MKFYRGLKRFFIRIGQLITFIIDFFYPPFEKFVSRQLFRYVASGGANLILDWILYFLLYNFVFKKQTLHLPFVAISAHIASLLVTFPITLLTGFLLQKYVTFTASQLRGRKQLRRYMTIVGINLMINYFGLNFLVIHLQFYPTIAKMLITVVCVMFSYFGQKHFTFKIE